MTLSTNPAWRNVVDLLACPETLQPLVELKLEELAGLNQRIAAGSCVKVNGTRQERPVEAALKREDGRVVYRVENGIIVLLQEEGIQTESRDVH